MSASQRVDTMSLLDSFSELQRARSPLDALGRKASLRREEITDLGIQEPREQWGIWGTSGGHDGQRRPPPRQQDGEQWAPQQYLNSQMSPLLHGRFARDSYATHSSRDSGSRLSNTPSSSIGYRYYDDNESVYSDLSTSTAAQRHSGQPPTTLSSPGDAEYVRMDYESSPHVGNDANPILPAVVVSAAETDAQELHAHPGRTPRLVTGSSNFSLPGRPTVPQSDDQKRRVLERNMRKQHSPLWQDSSLQGGKMPSNDTPSTMLPSETFSGGASSLATASTMAPQSANSKVKGPNTPSLSYLSSPQLPSTQPPRPLSPATTLYSTYSYYPYENIASDDSRAATPNGGQQHPPLPSQEPTSTNKSANEEHRAPHEYLQLGIQCHEANKLEDSAMYFEKSAKENGGCGIGMLMWGLTLRHGWGCLKDEKMGFKWLRRAAECAVEDLENARVGVDANVVQVRISETHFHSANDSADRTCSCHL